MRAAALLVLVFAAACGGARAPAPVHASWEAVYGTYEFTGDVPGQTLVTVQGSVRIEAGRYYLESNQGVCDEELPLAPSATLTLSCPPLMLTLRRRGDVFDEEGTITLTVREAAPQPVCRQGTDGRQVCGSQPETMDARRQGRAKIVRVAPTNSVGAGV